jgi:hypothetical protein
VIGDTATEQYVPSNNYDKLPYNNSPPTNIVPSTSFPSPEPKPQGISKSILNNPITVTALILIVFAVIALLCYLHRRKTQRLQQHKCVNITATPENKGDNT